jgi:hypothetical protein
MYFTLVFVGDDLRVGRHDYKHTTELEDSPLKHHTQQQLIGHLQ